MMKKMEQTKTTTILTCITQKVSISFEKIGILIEGIVTQDL